MAGRSRKEQLEEMLAEDPKDSFLRYGLAMEYASAGEDEEASRRLLELIEEDSGYLAAYLQAGQVLLRLGQDEEARRILQKGIAEATRVGDSHAAGEMSGLLATLG